MFLKHLQLVRTLRWGGFKSYLRHLVSFVPVGTVIRDRRSNPDRGRQLQVVKGDLEGHTVNPYCVSRQQMEPTQDACLPVGDMLQDVLL